MGSPYEERFPFTARSVQNSVDNPFKMKLHKTLVIGS